ncbi:hypothetical protein [Sphingomonas sp.]|uniref:hypothetical protein n=1 Tax=Sphingomonas sp. TaxID=28214 RepID=UPI00178DDF5B|nr:hypothetical protein [Sphingomonas sp.]MBA3512391.1 hypothetical protein [Sphingomonas sp.]
MIRTLAGLAAGLAVALITIAAVEAIGNQLFPPPAGYDMTSGSSETLPFETLVWPAIGWFLGAVAGSWVAIRVSGERWAGWAIAVFVLAATILNLVLITHPPWMIVAGVIAPVLGAWIGQMLPKGRPIAAD